MEIRKRIFITIIMSIAILLPYNSVSAAEKELKVELDKDYVSCIFNLSFENAGEYEAVLTDTNGNTHEYTKLDDTHMTCNMEKTPMGTYVTHMTNGDIETDIGKVTLTVSTNKSQTTDIVDNNIKIGRDISGIKMFFKDDKFIATWTDETCGTVNVKVINLDTAETIKNEKVTDRNFECEIDDSVKQIVVSIVPSSSSSIKGAELTYNFDVDNHPDATVTFPDIDKINQDKITVKVDMGDTYGIYVEDNEKCVLTTDMMVKGSYDIEVPLNDDGKNDLMFYIVDKDGNMRSTFKSIYKDTVPPSLSLSEEYDGMKINTQQYTISGNVSNYSTVSVNGEEILPATDGYFESTLNLHWGENKIHITAADDAGNETSYDLKIIAEEPKNSMDPKMFVFIGAAIGILIFLQIQRKKTKTVNENEQMEFAKDIVNEGGDGGDRSSSKKDRKEKHKLKFSLGFKQKSQTLKDEEILFQTGSNNLFDENEEDEYEEDNNYEEVSEYENEGKYEGEDDWLKEEDELSRNLEDSCQKGLDNEDIYNRENIDNGSAIYNKNLFETADAKSDKDGDDIYDDELFDMEDTDKTSGIAVEEVQATCNNDTFGKKSERTTSSFVKALFIKKKSDAVTKEIDINSFDSTSQSELRDEKEELDVLANEETVKIEGSHETLNKEEISNLQVPKNEQPQTVINIITNQPPKKKRKEQHQFIGNVIHMGVMLGIFYIIFQIVLLTGFIKSESMEPTLMTGDFIVGNRLAYKKIEPQRGDIILFKMKGEILGKRVIGVPGDVITFEGGKVIVNNEELDESKYLSEDVQTEADKVFEVPKGYVFVLGDNRKKSYDSRYWEDEPYVAYEDIVGKLLFNVSMPSDAVDADNK